MIAFRRDHLVTAEDHVEVSNTVEDNDSEQRTRLQIFYQVIL